MKRCCIIFLFSIIFSLNVIYSNQSFQIERLATDYNGTIEINNRIIVYGNNGILTYSDDFGKNWRQINLGEFNDLVKIIKDEDGTLFALTPKNILFSRDGGSTWTQRTLLQEKSIVDFALRNDTIYFITKNFIGVVDKNFKTPPQVFLQFDDFISFSKCVVLEKYLFVVEGKYYIFRVDLISKEIDTIDIHENLESYYRDVEQIKVKGSNLYVLVANGLLSNVESEYVNKRHLVVKSTDLGRTWEIVTSNLPVSLDFLIEEEDFIATLSPICFYFGVSKPYFGMSFIRANQNEFSEYIQTDTNGIWLPYYFKMSNLNEYKINSILKIKDSLIVAVGKDKLILLSYDNGKTWEIKSFFKPIYNNSFGHLSYNVQVLGKDTILVITNTKPFCFLSTNSGATFLSISNKQVLEIESNLSFQWIPISFANGSFGYISFKGMDQSKIETLVVVYSKDFGKSFSVTEYHPGYLINNDSISFALFHSGFYLKETNEFLVVILLGTNYESYSGPKFVLYRLDDKFQFIDSTFVNFYLTGLIPFSEGLLFSDNSFLYKSNDYGKTFETLSQFPRTSYYRNKKDYLEYSLLGTIANQLLIFESTPASSRLLKFDLENNSIDSLPIIKTELAFLFNLNDTAIIATKDNIFLFPNIKNEFDNFHLIPIDSIIADSALISGFIKNETSEIILILKQINKAQTGFFETLTPLSLAKLIYNQTYLKVEPEIKTNHNYLYASPPFPNPSDDWVETQVFWDCLRDFNSINFYLFDNYGRKLNVPREIIPTGNCSNILRFNISFLPSGIYYIAFTNGTRNIIFPIVLLRK